MRYLILIASLSIVFSCSKDNEDIQTPPENSVSYAISIQMKWQQPQFTNHPDAHFTIIAGMIHGDDADLFLLTDTASRGLEDVAEIGNIGKISNELSARVNSGKALSAFYLPAPAITGKVDTTLSFTLQHNSISFASMLAPSPDWFMGINHYNLLQNNKWVNSVTIPIYLYDAGTEDGDVFGYDNAPTSPLQLVKLLTPANASVLANGNASLAAIGSISFTKN